MNKLTSAVENKKFNETNLLEQAFADLITEVKEFDRDKKGNALNLKKFRNALADNLPTTFPKDELCDAVVFFEKFIKLSSQATTEQMDSDSPDSVEDKEKSHNSSGDDPVNEFFGMGVSFSRIHTCTAESFIYSVKYIISIPMESILSVFDDLRNDSGMNVTTNDSLENKLFLLANCFWSENESRAKLYAKYVFKNGILHDD